MPPRTRSTPKRRTEGRTPRQTDSTSGNTGARGAQRAEGQEQTEAQQHQTGTDLPAIIEDETEVEGEREEKEHDYGDWYSQGDAESQASGLRRSNAGSTPAPGQRERRSGDGSPSSSEPAPQGRRAPVVNYRMEIEGPRGDISLTCDCVPRCNGCSWVWCSGP